MGAVGACIVDFLIAFGMLLVLMLGYGCVPGLRSWQLPALVLGLTLTALGVGTLLSALTVAYRDFRHVLPFMVQLWMFATPAIYLQNEGGWRSLARRCCWLNPANGFIAQFPRRGAGHALRPPFAGRLVPRGHRRWCCWERFYFRRGRTDVR